jgi:hypothetical protein
MPGNGFIGSPFRLLPGCLFKFKEDVKHYSDIKSEVLVKAEAGVEGAVSCP